LSRFAGYRGRVMTRSTKDGTVGRVPPGLVAVLTLAMALPMLVLYAIGALGPQLVTDLGVDRTELGALPATGFAVAAVLSLGSGRIVDRLGTQGAGTTLFLVVAVSFTAMAFAGGFGPLLAAIALCGIAQALSNPVTNRVIAERIPAHARGTVVGIKQSGVQLAALVAGLGLPSIAAVWGWQVALAWVPPVALTCLIATLRLPHATGGQGTGGAPLLPAAPGRPLRWLLALQLSLGAGLATVTTFVPLYTHQDLGTSEPHAALVLAGFGVSGIVSRVLWTSMAGRRDDPWGLQLSLALFAAIAAGALWLSSEVPAGGLVLVWAGTLGVGATAVAANAVSMLIVINDRRFGPVGHASALASCGFFAGFVVSPPLAGLLADTAGFGAAWALVIGAFLLATLCATVLQRLDQATARAPAA
jgi:predicted MFS family arabinose efflux permease